MPLPAKVSLGETDLKFTIAPEVDRPELDTLREQASSAKEAIFSIVVPDESFELGDFHRYPYTYEDNFPFDAVDNWLKAELDLAKAEMDPTNSRDIVAQRAAESRVIVYQNSLAAFHGEGHSHSFLTSVAAQLQT